MGVPLLGGKTATMYTMHPYTCSQLRSMYAEKKNPEATEPWDFISSVS